jgi:hypothetical protein
MLERGMFCVFNNLCIDFVPFEKPENRDFTSGSSVSFAFALASEIAFVDSEIYSSLARL